jgi:hypothetical protein
VQLALIGRYYERIGDHAVNIGNRVQYMVTGWLPEHSGAARAVARAERAVTADGSDAVAGADGVAGAQPGPGVRATQAGPEGETDGDAGRPELHLAASPDGEAGG